VIASAPPSGLIVSDSTRVAVACGRPPRSRLSRLRAAPAVMASLPAEPIARHGRPLRGREDAAALVDRDRVVASAAPHGDLAETAPVEAELGGGSAAHVDL
jgi:hypothetical protein